MDFRRVALVSGVIGICAGAALGWTGCGTEATSEDVGAETSVYTKRQVKRAFGDAGVPLVTGLELHQSSVKEVLFPQESSSPWQIAVVLFTSTDAAREELTRREELLTAINGSRNSPYLFRRELNVVVFYEQGLDGGLRASLEAAFDGLARVDS